MLPGAETAGQSKVLVKSGVHGGAPSTSDCGGENRAASAASEISMSSSGGEGRTEGPKMPMFDPFNQQDRAICSLVMQTKCSLGRVAIKTMSTGQSTRNHVSTRLESKKGPLIHTMFTALLIPDDLPGQDKADTERP